MRKKSHKSCLIQAAILGFIPPPSWYFPLSKTQGKAKALFHGVYLKEESLASAMARAVWVAGGAAQLYLHQAVQTALVREEQRGCCSINLPLPRPRQI